MAERSYVCPSEVMTGCFIISLVIQHKNSSGMSSSFGSRLNTRKLLFLMLNVTPESSRNANLSLLASYCCTSPNAPLCSGLPVKPCTCTRLPIGIGDCFSVRLDVGSPGSGALRDALAGAGAAFATLAAFASFLATTSISGALAVGADFSTFGGDGAGAGLLGELAFADADDVALAAVAFGCCRGCAKSLATALLHASAASRAASAAALASVITWWAGSASPALPKMCRRSFNACPPNIPVETTTPSISCKLRLLRISTSSKP
mmetsp:Transcript_122994/g.282023  ORF Transcript_122994/g.282023 Transcript_122994/m.282023 type:complete len:263 (+) Transcript_122994:1947-2735(+)